MGMNSDDLRKHFKAMDDAALKAEHARLDAERKDAQEGARQAERVFWEAAKRIVPQYGVWRAQEATAQETLEMLRAAASECRQRERTADDNELERLLNKGDYCGIVKKGGETVWNRSFDE